MGDKQLDRKGAQVANALKAPVAVGFCGSLGYICSRSLVVRRNKKNERTDGAYKDSGGL